MPDKKEEEETPEAGVRRIDMRALERGVRKALEIKPKDRGKKKREGHKRNQIVTIRKSEKPPSRTRTCDLDLGRATL